MKFAASTMVGPLVRALLATTCLTPGAVWAADFTVTNNADSGAGSLRQAIINANTAGGSNNIIINSGVGTITLTSADLPTIANNATITGNGNTLSGGGTFRGLFIGGFSGTTQTTVSVSVSDLTIANARAQGGNGTRAGGGGAGLGGALFVANRATLTVSNVTLSSNSAVGGTGGSGGSGGGGGGMGGNGGSVLGGGGGLGVGAAGGNNLSAGSAGIASGASAAGTGGTGAGGGTAGGASGGGGGGAVSALGGGSAAGGGVGGANGVNGGGGTLNGGAGGFGGGGGAAGSGDTGGAGGFGGGGGQGATPGAGGFGGGGAAGATAGAGGFGGGTGAAGVASGGGGAGLGGAVFVQEGGTFNIAGAFNVTGGTVTAGAAGGVGGTAGSAFGVGIFLQGNGTVNFAPGSGVIQTMSNAIADQTGSGGTGANAGSWTLAKSGPGTLVLQTANTYSGGTTVTGGLINFAAANNFGSGQVTLNGGGLQWATGNTTDISGQLASLGSGGATFDTNGNNVTFASALGGSGGVTKAGAGTLTLSGANTYSGATTINAGTLALASGASLASALTINAGTFAINGNTTVSTLSGSGGAINLASGILTVNNSTNATLASTISGAGGLAKAGSGTLNLTGASTYTGGTSVSAGTLAVNGSIVGNVAVGNGGTLGGTGTIAGNVAMAGTLAPGNSIGTLTVNGNYAQNVGSTYQVEVNATGQSDKLNVSGGAAIAGGTVAVQAQSGTYARNTTYTILTANGGVIGAYSGITSNFAFLTPTLLYDANNVYLNLFLNQSAFAAGAQTSNQYAVGTVLDQNWISASGDFATVLSALSVLSTTAGPAALDAISGQQYADFGTTNVANASLFMNTLGQQMANARSGTAPGARVALAQACGVEACDDTLRLSAWFSGLGGLGSVQGNGNSSTLTYNVGGAAAGLDYRVTPNVLVGLGVGYTHGTQWVNSFMGQGWTNSVSIAAYGSFTQAGFYADALAGYAYLGNQMQRQILIPGLQQRTASGSTGANQFLAQLETGYKLGVWDALTVTPFGRFQTSITTQNAFTESGANSLNLSVAQQTTNSVRTVLGAEFGSTIPLGAERALGWNVRLGWQHEYASTARPISAAFGGAPSSSFTVYGATPTRDAAIVGFSATTSVAAATQLYLRYDGELGGGTDNHALTAGLRMSW